jgi:galactose mutarotase-like enzyme
VHVAYISVCVQGFPGTVHAWVIYKLWANANRLQTTWLATTDKPTPSESLMATIPALPD